MTDIKGMCPDAPDETKCFICVKIVKTESDDACLMVFKNSEKAVVICTECYEWASKNLDAAMAIVTGRLMSLGKRDDED